MSDSFEEFFQSNEHEYADSEERCPNIFFVILDCRKCSIRWAISPDLNNIASGNIWFFNAKFTPKFPPAFSMSTTGVNPVCPQCTGELEFKSRYAMLTKDGEHWLFLDKTKAVG